MAKDDVKTPRWGWALTGSGHFVKESLAIIKRLPDLDLFVSSAAEEVLKMYKQELVLMDGSRIYRDRTASAAPVGNFYYGVYHTLILGPATSNTVAKCVYGISDNLATNVFAQAGKCRVPAIVFACDTAPDMDTDLENTEKLKTFEDTTVVETVEEFERAIDARQKWLNGSSS
jgi:dihydromethanopterin reductase (acceptor)